MFRTEDYLDLAQFEFPELFDRCEHVWDALRKLSDFVKARARPGVLGQLSGQPFIGPNVQIGEGTVIEHGAVIKGPAIIGRDCEIRASAYIRENVIVGDGCVLGNACEFKNSILLNGATVPHFSYVGDSILGHNAHLGAGVILSNIKSIQSTVRIHHLNGERDTGLRKFGSVVGDGADIGCNCVLNPGSLIGRRTVLYPNILWRGVAPSDSIIKLRQEHELVVRRQ